MDEEAGIYARESNYLDRYVQAGVAGERVLSVSFPTGPDDGAGDTHPLLDRIEEYLQGAKENFSDVSVALTMPTDQREVLETLREIPYGEQVSVEKLTGMVPGLRASESEDRNLVRTALDANPLPLILPDHRVRDGPSGAPPAVEQKLRVLEGL